MKRLVLIGLVCLTALSANADDTNLYVNPTAGFEVVKPAAWQFLTADENLENMKRTQLEDEDFHALMLKYSTAPMVAMMKYPEPFDDLNPSFKVNIKPLGQLKGMSAVEIIGLFPSQLEGVFKDFELVAPPTEVEVSGIESGYVRMNYSLEIPDGRTFPTTSELWVVPRGEYFFLIGSGTRQDGKTGTRSEIESILKSVKIRP